MKNMLSLEDLKGKTEKEILDHLVHSWEAPADVAKKFRVLVAYESVGDHGCDSSGWYLLRQVGSRQLFEVSGSHCSCYGFEGQFTPELTDRKYLKSENFSISTGGYDEASEANVQAVKDWIAENL